MFGLSGSEVREAASLSESVRHGLEDMSSARDEPLMRKVAGGFEVGVHVSLATAIRQLHSLETRMGNMDEKELSEVNDLIDAIVDYLVIEIAMIDARDDPNSRTKRRLEHIRRDAGRLAQYICQLTEGPP